MQLQEYEIKYLCTKAREIFIGQPILLELEAPIKICGTFKSPYIICGKEAHAAQEISTDNTMTSFDCLSMAVSPPRPITCFWEITSIVENSL